MLFLVIPTLIVLLLMAFQDIKRRSIMLLLFFLLAGLTASTALIHHSAKEVMVTVLVNLLFVSIHTLAVFLYLFLKHRTFINPFSGHLGLGDLLFWIVISPAFSPLNYIVTFLISVSFALGVFLLMRCKGMKEKTVPLAGLQALFYAAFFLTNALFLDVDCYDDSILVYLLL